MYHALVRCKPMASDCRHRLNKSVRRNSQHIMFIQKNRDEEDEENVFFSSSAAVRAAKKKNIGRMIPTA